MNRTLPSSGIHIDISLIVVVPYVWKVGQDAVAITVE